MSARPDPCAQIRLGKRSEYQRALDIWVMALWVGERAKKSGLKLVRIACSKTKGSDSQYITLRDTLDRLWQIRISSHIRADRTPVPHVELITRDGRTGRDWLESRIAEISQGNFDWFDHRLTEREPSSRIRRLIRAARDTRFSGRKARRLPT